MKRWLAVAALAGAVLLCYRGALDHAFVFDDQKLVVENETIRDLRNIPAILTATFRNEPYLARDHWIDPGYRPVRMISYALDEALFGGAPRGFRLTNILLHILNALLAGAIAARLIGRPARFPAAFLFALHPLATEAVTYISGRRDVLFTLFYLASLVLFLDHRARSAEDFREPGPIGRRLGALRPAAIAAFFVLALGTKEMAVTLPLACAALDLALGGPRSLRRRAGLHGTLFSLAAVYSLLVIFGKNPGEAAAAGAAAERIGGGGLATVLTMARVVWHYLGLMAFPATLNADYSFDAFPASRGLFEPWTGAAALAGFALVAAALVRSWRAGARVEATLGALLFVTLLPVLQIVPHPEPIAERYLYLPMIAPILLFLRGLVVVIRGGAAKAVLAILLVAIALEGVRTAVRNRDWRNEETLFASVVATHPRCARANLGLAKALIERGQNEAALDALDRSIEVLPSATWDSRAGGMLVTALFERAKARAEVGLYDEALRDLDRVLAERTTGGATVARSPKFAHVRLNRAATLKRRGDREAAGREYEAVLALLDGFEAPDEAARAAAREARREAEIQLGVMAIERGEKEAGLARLTRAAGPPPPAAESERAWDILGRAALRAGDLARAEEVFRALAAARLEGEKEAWYRLAETLDRKGDLGGARGALERALALDPGFAAAHFSLADQAMRLGELDTAEREILAVLKRQPENRRARLMLTDLGIRRGTAGKPPAEAGEKPLDAAARARRKAENLRDIAIQAWSANQPEGARQALEAAEAADPTWAEPSDLLGGVLEALGRPDEAARAYERAVKRDSGRETARAALARLKGTGPGAAGSGRVSDP